MKILVTGGAGFIGSNLVDSLLEQGQEVVVVDNLSTGSEKYLNPHAKFYLADICNRELIEDIFSRELPDMVDHHAAQIDVRKSLENPVFDAENNILGSLNLIQASIAFKVKKLIYISTGGAVYGEPIFLPVTEEHPVNPESPYGASKHTVEHYLLLFRQTKGLNYTVLRYPNVYGPRQNPLGEAGVNAIFIHQMLTGVTPTIFGDGEQLRDYVFVRDIVSANILAMNNGDGGIYNIGCGQGTSVNQIYRELSKIIEFGRAPIYKPARPGEIYKIYLDAKKAKKDLGWSPLISFSDGLRATVEWHKKELNL
jgi:UDP-glucose 4-epimerase